MLHYVSIKMLHYKVWRYEKNCG